MNNPGAKTPYLWAILAGMALWCLASIKLGKREPWDDQFYWAIVYPLAIFISGALGFLFPERPWRWPLTLFLAQFGAMAIRNGEPGNLWPLGLLLFCVIATPGIALAKIGSWARQKYLHD